MRITITPDVRACMLAGVEPATSLDIDLSGLDVSDRQAIAAELTENGVWPRPIAATVMSLVESALDMAEERRAKSDVASIAAAQAEADRIHNLAVLASRPIVLSYGGEVGCGDYAVKYDVLEVSQEGLRGQCQFWNDRTPQDVRDAWKILKAEVNAMNAASEDAAKTESARLKAEILVKESLTTAAGIAARAAMPLIDGDGRILGTTATAARYILTGIRLHAQRIWYPETGCSIL